MELSNIIAFICGGLISAIVFYPRHKEKKKEYLAAIMSYQFYSGIYFAQKVQLPHIISEEHCKFMAAHNVLLHKKSADFVFESMEKL